jgi:hypothetical protein
MTSDGPGMKFEESGIIEEVAAEVGESIVLSVLNSVFHRFMAFLGWTAMVAKFLCSVRLLLLSPVLQIIEQASHRLGNSGSTKQLAGTLGLLNTKGFRL